MQTPISHWFTTTIRYHQKSPVPSRKASARQCRLAVPRQCRRSDVIDIAKLQELVYDILPLTTAITDYALGLGKLSANGEFFPGAQIVVSL